MKTKIQVFVGFLFLACLFQAQAEVRLPAVFANHMVIQRQAPVHVWGFAAAGESVQVAFRDVTRSAVANRLGRWEVSLPAGEAGGPFTMEIAAANQISISDILVGDVWFASGQSNMEFPTAKAVNAEEELQNADHPDIRLFQINKASEGFPQLDVLARSWKPANRESVAEFTAVGYFFARELNAGLKIPIGIIESDWGGTPAEAWTSLPALTADATLLPVLAAYAKMEEAEGTNRLEEQAQKAQIAEALTAGKPAPTFPWHPELRSWTPSGLFNAMVAPVTPFPIRGVIWYQGESNANEERAPTYNRLFETLIRDWRTRWNVGDFPFLFVQIANWKPGSSSYWPTVRDAQRRTLELKNTGMAVTIDIGDPADIHPKNKQDVGHRLALAARAISYGEDVEYSGPLYQSVVREEAALRVAFTHARGLLAKGGPPTGFEIAGQDHKFVPATAQIVNDHVVLSNSGVTTPVYARYGWDSNPACNLYNAADLPASPFTSEP